MLQDIKSPAASSPAMTRSGLLVLVICWLAVVSDGYDVVIYGAVLPSLFQEPGWGLTPSTAGMIGSLPLLGMFFGSMAAGTIADRFGRRPVLLSCLIWFSVFTALCALAPSPEIFGGLRFLSGLGLGGLLPIASALTSEFTPTRFRNLVFAVMFSGFPIGGILAALTGLAVIPNWGWRAMFVLALVPLLIVVPLALKFLPESVEVLRRRGRHEAADQLEEKFGLATPAAEATVNRAKVPELFGRNHRLATFCFLWAPSCACS